jgi:predicted  nucleic acid-binding Zn-ribbon protein
MRFELERQQVRGHKVRDQLEALSELAKIDRGFRQFDAELEELRGRLEELRADVGRIGELLEREKAQLADVERMRGQAVVETEELGERITRSNDRANVARNTRERDAATREVEVLRKEREERKQRAADLEKGVGEVRESITRHEDDFKKLAEALAQEEEHVTKRSGEIEVLRDEITRARADVTKRLRPDVLRKYDGVRARRGVGVAEAYEGMCYGCHVALPPQFYAKLKATGEVMQCPSCLRILIVRSTPAAGAAS